MSEFRGNVLTAEELVRRRNKSDTIFPLRGPKLFSPSDSWLESKQLQSLLDATKDLLAEERVERESALSRAEWDDNLKVARVTRRVGHHFAKFGHEEDTTVFLYPEEALYMLETNTLEMLYGGVSMSIQQAYMILLNAKSGCTFLDYVVFSHLLKNGFKVLRHSPKRTVTRYEQLIGLQPGKVKNKKLRGENIKVNNCLKNKKVKEERNVKDDNKQSKCTKDANEKFKNSNEWKNEGGNISNVEGLFDGNSSDIEILSEKCTMELRRVDEGNSEEKNYEDEDEEREGEGVDGEEEKEDRDEEEELNFGCSSFSSSRDSDCQIVFSKKEENIEYSLEKRSIEEIHLSDSDESVGCVANNVSPMKGEATKSEITDIGVQECDVQCEELSNSSSGHFCEISKETGGLIQFDESKFKDLDTINSSYLNSSNDLLESICGRQDLSTLNSKEKNLSLINNVSIASASEMCVNILNSTEEKLNENIEIKEESVNNTNENTIKIESKKDCLKDQDRIEVIDLDDEPRIIESRWTILNSFPNAAGCHTVLLDVPPPSLCPTDVRPFKQRYVIVLERLKDPRYGGSHKKRQAHQQSANRSNHQRYEHRGNISRRHSNRYRSRPFNRRFNLRPRFRGHKYAGHYPECYQGDVRFPNPTEFSPGSLMYPPIQNNYLSPRNQGHFPYFSGHQHFNQPHQPHRFDQRWDHPFNIHNQGPRDYPCNPHGQGPRNRRVLCRSSGRPRYRERTSQESMITEVNSNCEDLNEEGGSYIPFNLNLSSDETSPERRTRSQVHKRNSEPSESSHSYCSGRKYSRVREDYSPFEQGNNTELGHSGNGTPFQMLDSNCPVIQSRRESLNSTTEDSVTDSSEDSSDSESSEESCDEFMQESEGKQEHENVGSLLKPGFMHDIDAALKSLQIVKTTKLSGLSATVDEMLLSIKFDLYLPSTPFKKSDPPVPDFRLVIMSPDQTLPSSRQLSFLEGGFEDSVPLLFAIASADSVAFFLHSFLEFPLVHSSDKVQT